MTCLYHLSWHGGGLPWVPIGHGRSDWQLLPHCRVHPHLADVHATPPISANPFPLVFLSLYVLAKVHRHSRPFRVALRDNNPVPRGGDQRPSSGSLARPAASRQVSIAGRYGWQTCCALRSQLQARPEQDCLRSRARRAGLGRSAVLLRSQKHSTWYRRVVSLGQSWAMLSTCRRG